MGKKSKLKAIRKIAQKLPSIPIKKIEGSIVKGAELLDRGVKEVENKPVYLDGDYKQKKIVTVPLNHNRKMKQFYNRYGVNGVNFYIKTVIDHAKSKTA
jgi:hypothetical protein